MESIGDIMAGMIQKSLQNEEPGDYYGEDGFLYCGKCHTRKQHEITLPADGDGTERKVRVGIACKCQAAVLEAEERERDRKDFEQRMEALRRDGITDPAYLRYTFAQDDRRNPDVTDVCLRYVQNWKEMKAENIGILFYGGVGTGKSFLACCIANALIDRCVKASVTNFPRIMNRLQGFGEDKQGFLDKLNRYDCLVIDDLGVERDTSYSVEQIYNVVDARSRSGKPLIVTTNLSLDDLRNPSSMGYARIYDRVLEMCPIKLKLAGDSRRTVNAAARRDRAKEILGM